MPKTKRGKGVRTVSEELRLAVRDSGKTLYRVAKDAGVNYSSLHRFMAGRQLPSAPVLDKLSAYLGLRLVQERGDE
jgi:hypothetical protein